MKLKSLLPLLFLVVFISNSFANCDVCSITYNGLEKNLNVADGQTLCIKSGTFSGNFNMNGQNITICISKGATFNVNNFSFKTGTKIFNSGTLNINSATVDGASAIDNSGTINFLGNINYNNNLNITNQNGSTINYSSNLELKKTSQYINNGTINIKAEFNSENVSTFINNGHLKIQNNFNPGGTFINNGFVIAQGFININPDSKVTNSCTFFSNKGFNNNSNNIFNNNGFIRADGPIQLNGNSSFQQSKKALLIGHSLINNSKVIGSGNYYFSGETRNQGPFGQDAKGINFYDVTNTTSKIFDIENQVPHNTVTKFAIAKEDTSLVNRGCSDNFPIPVATDIVYHSEINKVVLVPVSDIAWDDKVGLDFFATNLLSFNNILRATSVEKRTAPLMTYVDEGKGTYYFYPENDIIEFHPELNYTGTSQIDYYVKNTLGYRSNLATVTIIIDPTVLPVELVGFEAKLVGQQVNLNWNTASEKNNDYFQVERSLDGLKFEKIGQVSGNGNSSTPISYQFIDAQPLSGVSFYRLLQVDYDGQSEFSNIISVENSIVLNNKLTLFPNPASDIISIQSDKLVQSYVILNLAGSVIKTTETTSNSFSIALDELQSGMYLLNVRYVDQSQETLKFLKK